MRWIWSEEHMSETCAKLQSVCAAATPSPLPPRGRALAIRCPKGKESGGRVGDGGERALYLVRCGCPSTPDPSSRCEEGNAERLFEILAVFRTELSACAAEKPSHFLPRGGRVGDGGEMASYLACCGCPSTPDPSSRCEEGNVERMSEIRANFRTDLSACAAEKPSGLRCICWTPYLSVGENRDGVTS